ncbi:hypothetical protein SAMN04487936_102551 [Halobacillus dabanensis]|uniref:Uncharacterized protein n=1 Tax=Halobacillus dabanensis TaxID=240302 RepID=A0A1I3SA83_HALDA|nr:hypothetical protein SAMN04487936_102551 [Halobacillus dabanensis]
MIAIGPILHIIALFFLSGTIGLLIRLYYPSLRKRWVFLINTGFLFFYSFLFPMIFVVFYFYFFLSFISSYLGLCLGRGVLILISREEQRHAIR